MDRKQVIKKRFRDWLEKRFYEWRGDRLLSISDFADYLGVQQQSVSGWWNGRSIPSSSDHITKLAAAFPDIYDILEVVDPRTQLPPQVPPELVSLFISAHEESVRRLQEKHLSGSEPEAQQIIKDTFIEFGFNLKKTE
jgi:transcriptional regulator with XRE-family HTH domain